MPFHEITARGKKWICLTDISSKADESLYEHGKVLYERLFTEVEKEDYQNFRHYLADTAVERLRPDRAETIDTLFLALEEKSGQPKGFLYSSWYPPLGLVFVPYVGFLDNRSPQFFAGVPEVITKEREYVGLAGKPIEALLFELETFDPLHLAPSSIRAMWTPDQKTANKRAQLTRVYQGKGGAWLTE